MLRHASHTLMSTIPHTCRPLCLLQAIRQRVCDRLGLSSVPFMSMNSNLSHLPLWDFRCSTHLAINRLKTSSGGFDADQTSSHTLRMSRATHRLLYSGVIESPLLTSTDLVLMGLAPVISQHRSTGTFLYTCFL